MDRIARVTGPAVLLLVAVASVVVALLVGRGSDTAVVGDPGALVRFGLPIARVVVDLSAAVTIGGLALATIGLSRTEPEWNRAVDVVAAAAGVWTVSSAVATFCTFIGATNARVTADSGFGQSLGVFITSTDVGVAWLVTVLVAAVVTVLCFAVRGRGAVAVTTGIAIVGLVPLAQQGHASGTADHDAAVTALGLHLVGAALWVGGLVMLVLLRGVLAPERVAVVAARYSGLALCCAVLVAVSGYASAQIRVGTWAALLTPYGLLVLVKTAALVGIVVLAVVVRRRAIASLAADGGRRRPWWTLVVVELAVMGAASGFAAALGRTRPPVLRVALDTTRNPSPAELLTDDRLPAAPGPFGWLTYWDVDLFWLLGAVLLAAAYAAGVVRVRRAGGEWPVRRSVAAGLALVSLVVATSGSLHTYDRFLVSAHVGAHVVLGIVVPALAWAAAPVRLVRDAVHPRRDGSSGLREWTAVVVDGVVVRYLAQPFPSILLLAAAWWALYDTQVLRWSVGSTLGGTLVDVGFLLVGLLALPTLLTPVAAGAQDPSGAAVGVRIAGAAVVTAGMVSLGVAMRGPLGLLQASWFGAMGRTWGPDPLVDQARAGAVLVVAGVALLATVVVVSFVRLRLRRRAVSAPASTRPRTDVAPAHDGAERSWRGATTVDRGSARGSRAEGSAPGRDATAAADDPARGDMRRDDHGGNLTEPTRASRPARGGLGTDAT